MPNPAVFFSRCRPQGANPIDIVLRERRVFIGYPLWRDVCNPDPHHLRKAIVDLLCPDEEWNAAMARIGQAGHSQYSQRRQIQQNRNFVRTIEAGAIALVPRPDRGFIYAGRVKGPFQLLDDPPWAEEYLRLRNDTGCDEGGGEFSHRADVSQCFEVDHFREIPFPLVPAWIRRSLFGRSTYGRIWPLENPPLDSYAVLDELIDHPERAEQAWTEDPAEVEERLVSGVGPNGFEHLCVALLQLEHPDEIWSHVGGSGDGGIDGIGANRHGNVVGLLQCKWSYSGEHIQIADRRTGGGARQFLAALLHPTDITLVDGVEFWSRSTVTTLVIKHARRLPVAISLRIGKPL